MKTSHVVIGAGVAAVGIGALVYFAKKTGAASGYYPQAGLPAQVPGGAPRQVVAPTPSAKSTAGDILQQSTPLAIAALPYIADLFRDSGGVEVDSAPASSWEGLDSEPYLADATDFV